MTSCGNALGLFCDSFEWQAGKKESTKVLRVGKEYETVFHLFL